MRWKINTQSVFPYLSIIHDIIYIPFHSIPYELIPCGDYLTSLFLTQKSSFHLSRINCSNDNDLLCKRSKIDVTIAIILHERQIFFMPIVRISLSIISTFYKNKYILNFFENSLKLDYVIEYILII